MTKCRDDLTAITRYVTWNLDDRGGGALARALPDKTDMIAVYQVALKSNTNEEKSEETDKNEAPKGGKNRMGMSRNQPPAGAMTEQKPLAPMATKGADRDRDYQNLLQLMEEAVMSRDANRTNLVVGGLVQHIVAHWRTQFCQSVTTKFNCYFMLPFVEDFHRYIRRELQKVYEGEADGLADVFDLTSARQSLEMLRDELTGECEANKRLQEKFQFCARMMRTQQDGNDPAFNQKPSGQENLDLR
jgi:hypothetical protein